MKSSDSSTVIWCNIMLQLTLFKWSLFIFSVLKIFLFGRFPSAQHLKAGKKQISGWMSGWLSAHVKVKVLQWPWLSFTLHFILLQPEERYARDWKKLSSSFVSNLLLSFFHPMMLWTTYSLPCNVIMQITDKLQSKYFIEEIMQSQLI